MKKILVSLFALVFLIGCQLTQEEKSSEIQEEQISIPKEQTAKAELKISVDEKLEVMYSVFALTNYPLVSRHSTSYKTAVLEYFQPYQDHEAVAIAKRLFKLGFGADFPISWIYQYDKFPQLGEKNKVDFPLELIDLDSLDLFKVALQNFYVDANCERFFSSQKAFLEEMIETTRDSIATNDIIEIIEDYFGLQKNASYTLILSPLLHQGGFSVERLGETELYAIVGPNKVKDSIPQFDRVFLEQDMIIHEFGHNYANPIIDEYYNEMTKLEEVLFPKVKDAAEEEGYASWEAYLYELLDRSTTIRITEITYGHEAAMELLEYEKSVGFEHCEILLEALKQYEQQRDQYKSLSDFFPEIIRALEDEILTEQ